MSRAHRRLRASALLSACVIAFADAPSASASDAVIGAPVEQLALAVTYNGQAAPEPIVVHRQGAAVSVAASDLRALGIPVASDRPWIALQSIAGLAFAIDNSAQTLTMTLGPPPKQRLRIDAPAPAGTEPVSASGWGAVVNYDLSATYQSRRTIGGGLVDATVYSPAGYGFASALVSTDRSGPTRRVRRLDLGVTIADPAAVRRITLGDFIGRSMSFTRPVRMIGAQLTTDFSLRPDLVTFPVPSIDGQAAVPSAVDLIVNGSRRSAGEVEAGQFAVTDVPVQTGINTISVAVRDALGRERVQTVSTYTSPALLAPGLVAYSVEGGLVRSGYATRFDRYRGFALSAGLRRGVSSALTLEGHVEGDRSLAVVGAGAIASLQQFGLLEATLSTSQGSGGGVQFTAAWERIANPVSLTARLTLNSPGWRDLAAANGSVTRSHTLTLNAAFDLKRLGSLSGSLIDLGRGKLSVAAQGTAEIDPTRFAVGTYSVRLSDRFGFVGSAGGDLRRSGSFYASLGILATFGSRTSGYAGGLARAGSTSGQLDVVRNALLPGDVGYRASVTTGGVDRVAGGVEYLGAHGFYDVRAERTDGAVALRASTRGSLVLADGALFAGDRLTDSFAVVDTNRQAGVTIYRDNRPVGQTDHRGKLLVPNLRPYEATRIAFDPDQLPIDASTEASDATVRPAERVGVRVGFRIVRDQAMMLHLTLALTAVPSGTQLSVNDQDEVPVGFDGAVYLPTVQPVNRLVARLPDGTMCEASFARPAGYTIGSPPVDILCLPRPIAIAKR